MAPSFLLRLIVVPLVITHRSVNKHFCVLRWSRWPTSFPGLFPQSPSKENALGTRLVGGLFGVRYDLYDYHCDTLVLTDVFIVLITFAFLAYSKHFYIIFLGSV